MHPWHDHHWYHHRPSRLFWFAIGAAAATLWARHREMRDKPNHQCVRRRVDATSAVYNPIPPEYNLTANDSDLRAVPTRWSWGHKEGDREWSDDKERLKNLGKQAEDAMTDLSDSTLDSILSTVQTLKAKLAEHRVQRGQQQQQFFHEQLQQQGEQKKGIPQAA